MPEKSDVMILRDYFGYRQGDTAVTFLQELKALDPTIKAQLANGIRNGSLTY